MYSHVHITKLDGILCNTLFYMRPSKTTQPLAYIFNAYYNKFVCNMKVLMRKLIKFFFSMKTLTAAKRKIYFFCAGVIPD